jgi:hypothetical protein
VFPVRYGLHLSILHSAHRVYLCVPYGYHNKQRLFPQTALTGWALYTRPNVFSVWYVLNFYILGYYNVYGFELNVAHLVTILIFGVHTW